MYDLGYCTEIWYATMQRWIMTSKKLSFSTNIQRQCLTLFQRLSNVNCLLGDDDNDDGDDDDDDNDNDDDVVQQNNHDELRW